MSAKTPKPPALYRSLLALTCAGEDRRFLLADLEEEFEDRVQSSGLRSARSWYRRQALTSVAPNLRGRRVWSRIRQRNVASWLGDRATRQGGVSSAVEGLAGDLRYSVRALFKRPLFFVVVAGSLGLGIGAVTSTFTLMNGVLIQAPVGLHKPEELVTVYTNQPGERPHGTTSFLDYQDIKDKVPALIDTAAISLRPVTIGRENARNGFVEAVSANFFEVTGIRPVIGRPFAAEESTPKAPAQVTVLGHEYWTNNYQASEDVLGETIVLDREEFTIIGVAPPGIVSRRGPIRPDLWLPIGSLKTPTEFLEDRSHRPFLVLGRLTSSASLVQLEAQLQGLSQGLLENHAAWRDANDRERSLFAVSERNSRLNPHARKVLSAISAFLLGMTSLVLLIACSNVASLLMARTAQRRKELALRASLGASRARMVTMILMEGLLPGLAAAGIGLLVAKVAAHAINSIDPPATIPIRPHVEVDLRVTFFALGTAMISWMIFGLLPALKGTRLNLVGVLRGTTDLVKTRWLNPRNAMVIIQCAASLVLIVGASLFLRSLDATSDLDLGLNGDGVAIASKTLHADSYSDQERINYLEDLRGRLEVRPEVEAVAFSRNIELTFALHPVTGPVTVTGYQPTLDEEPPMHNAVSPGYLEILGIPVLSGRTIQSTDNFDAAKVAVVNQSFADRYWPGLDPIGRSFKLAGQAGTSGIASTSDTAEPSTTQSVTVVGLTRDGKYLDFDDIATPYFWTSLYQQPSQHVGVAVRGSASDEALVQLLAQEIAVEAGEVQLVAPSLLSDHLATQFMHLRLASRVLGAGGVFGLVLALAGIYGLASLAVSERRKEMAIRIAVGANRADIFRAILLEGTRSAAFGLALGLLIALPAARLLDSVLAEVSAGDPLAFAGASVLLIAASIAASAIPARRLLGMDPIQPLRDS